MIYYIQKRIKGPLFYSYCCTVHYHVANTLLWVRFTLSITNNNAENTDTKQIQDDILKISLTLIELFSPVFLSFSFIKDSPRK